MENTLHDRLRSHFQSVDGVLVEWGISDCTAWTRSWICKCGHNLAPLTYRSQSEARRLIVGAGSLAALWDEWLAPAGIFQTIFPQAGDVGIIETASFGQVGGIWIDGGGLLWRAENGATLLYPRAKSIVKSWGIQCVD